MASTMRSVDTRFWVDVWVRKLNALDRYVFLYFLTNPHSSWCGVYEVDLAMVSFETGIEETELTNVILPRLAPKIRYVDGWVYIPNFEKYHANHSEKTQKGIDNAWKVVPERIRLKLRDLYPIEGVSAFTSSSSSSLLGDSKESQNLPLEDNAKKDMAWKKYNENAHSDDLPAIDMDSGETIEDKTGQESKQITQLIEWAEMVRGQKFLDRPTQRKFAYQLKAAELSLSEIRQTYMALLNSEYWKEQKRLPDLKTVYSNLKNKKHE